MTLNSGSINLAIEAGTKFLHQKSQRHALQYRKSFRKVEEDVQSERDVLLHWITGIDLKSVKICGLQFKNSSSQYENLLPGHSDTLCILVSPKVWLKSNYNYEPRYRQLTRQGDAMCDYELDFEGSIWLILIIYFITAYPIQTHLYRDFTLPWNYILNTSWQYAGRQKIPPEKAHDDRLVILFSWL